MSHTDQVTVDALAGILDNLPKQGLTDAGIRELFHDLGLYPTSFAAQFHEAGGRAS